jgi:hypothetical protein
VKLGVKMEGMDFGEGGNKGGQQLHVNPYKLLSNT